MVRTGVGRIMKFFVKFLSVVLLLGVVGCSNYRLAGTPINLPFKSVYVEPVKNFSYAPQASNLLTNAISDAISQTPQIKVANKSDADAVLSVTITDYRKTPYATNSKDTALASSYKMYMTASCTLTMGSKIIFKDRSVRGSMILNARDGNFINNEYQSMPIITRDLGVKIKDAVIGIW